MSEFSTCVDFEELAAWIDGRVDEPTRSRLAAHVADCDRCAGVMEEVLAFSEEQELVEDGAGESAVAGEEDPTAERYHTQEADSGFAPADGRFQPVAARVRWKRYLAAGLATCVAVVGFRLIQQRPPSLAALRLELHSLVPEGQATRGEERLPLTEKEIPIARKCRLFLKETDTILDPEVLSGCLDLVARDPDLASQVVVEAPGLTSWIGSPDPLGTSSCQVLMISWEYLRGSRQNEMRPYRETCRARLGAPRS